MIRERFFWVAASRFGAEFNRYFCSVLEFFLVASRFHSETVNITLVVLRRNKVWAMCGAWGRGTCPAHCPPNTLCLWEIKYGDDSVLLREGSQ